MSDSYDHILEESFVARERDLFLRKTLAGGVDFDSTKHYLSGFFEKL
jgi:hypothetical protein